MFDLANDRQDDFKQCFAEPRRVGGETSKKVRKQPFRSLLIHRVRTTKVFPRFSGEDFEKAGKPEVTEWARFRPEIPSFQQEIQSS